jgi:hypothetical protein
MWGVGQQNCRTEISTVFPASHEQALQLFSASLNRSDELLPPSGATASAIIMVCGAAQFGAHTLRALGIAAYTQESPASIRAQENDTLLVSLLAFPEVLGIGPSERRCRPKSGAPVPEGCRNCGCAMAATVASSL